MTLGGSNFNDFPDNLLFQKCRFWVYFENERTGGTLLVVFKMHGLKRQKTGVSIKI